jgi:hypothetical protein
MLARLICEVHRSAMNVVDLDLVRSPLVEDEAGSVRKKQKARRAIADEDILLHEDVLKAFEQPAAIERHEKDDEHSKKGKTVGDGGEEVGVQKGDEEDEEDADSYNRLEMSDDSSSLQMFEDD